MTQPEKELDPPQVFAGRSRLKRMTSYETINK